MFNIAKLDAKGVLYITFDLIFKKHASNYHGKLTKKFNSRSVDVWKKYILYEQINCVLVCFCLVNVSAIPQLIVMVDQRQTVNTIQILS